MNTSILKDFQPVNDWRVDIEGPKWPNCVIPQYIVDETTKKRYWYESLECLEQKCLLLTLATPIVHPIAVSTNITYRVLKIISFSHFWVKPKEGSSPLLKARVKRLRNDCLRVILSPLALAGLELAAIYGIFNPLDARKVYGSIEKYEFGNAVLAPCFQPSATSHAFGGDPEKRNAF